MISLQYPVAVEKAEKLECKRESVQTETDEGRQPAEERERGGL